MLTGKVAVTESIHDKFLDGDLEAQQAHVELEKNGFSYEAAKTLIQKWLRQMKRRVK